MGAEERLRPPGLALGVVVVASEPRREDAGLVYGESDAPNFFTETERRHIEPGEFSEASLEFVAAGAAPDVPEALECSSGLKNT